MLGVDKNRIAICAISNALFMQLFEFIDKSFIFCYPHVGHAAKLVWALH